MAETGSGGLISCIMCKNEIPVDFLRKHTTFHHMIQEQDVVEKIYKMHFPSKEMEVQTSVSWINDMIELEEKIGNIEENLENSTSISLSVNEESFSYGIIIDETEENPVESGSTQVTSEAESEVSLPESSTCIEEKNLWAEADFNSLIYRYRCPYCDTFGASDIILDHILLEHSIPGTSRTYPRYRRPRKQRMAVKVDKRDLTENIDDNVDRPNHCWLPCDATLPEGWKYSESDRNTKSYMSPTGEFLESRDQIIEYLLGLGFDLFHPRGYESITPSLVDCDGLCEGACDNFKIRKIFYEEGDGNMRRKTTKITYLDEASVSIIKDNVTDTNRLIEDVKTVSYHPPAIKGQRPWIVCIEDNKTEKNNIIISMKSHTNNLEVSEQSSSVSSRESTPSGRPSNGRKRKIGGKSGGILKKRKSSSRESTPRPSRNKSKTEKTHIVHEGIYVQCCKKKCQKWRLVTEFADASLVPEYWICSMNRDQSNRVCGVGGNSFNAANQDIEVKFSRGSLVWAKLKGFPWWPGMIDSCPDSDDFYWVDEDICRNEPTWYHVVYFEGRGTEVSRAWIRAEDIVSLTSPIRQPRGDTATRPGPLKQRLKNAMELAESAKSHPRKVRLEKFSFSALFEKKSSRKLKKRSVDIDQNHKAASTYQKEKKKVKTEHQVQQREEKNEGKRRFITGPIFSDEEEEQEEDEKREGGDDDDLLSQILKKYSVCEDEEEETKNHDEDHLSSTGSDEDKEEASLEETLLGEYSNHQVTEFLDIKLEKIDTLDVPVTESPQTNGVSSNCMTEVFIKPEELVSTLNPNLDRDFAKPPLPSDVLIALAVRNLDPNNEHGVTFSNIVAFLALHFPYYNRNQEECKEMIKTAYDNSEKIEKENFRIKSSLVPHLLVRINKFVTKNNLLIKESMLLAEFLDCMLQRFQGGAKCEAINYRPPYSCKNLSHLAFITLCPPTSIEQVMIFLKFLFPSLDQSKTFVEKDFEDWIRNDDQIQEYLSPGGDTMYLLQEGVYPVVQHQVRQFFSTKSNFARLKKSIFNPEFVNILLPNLHCENN